MKTISIMTSWVIALALTGCSPQDNSPEQPEDVIEGGVDESLGSPALEDNTDPSEGSDSAEGSGSGNEADPEENTPEQAVAPSDGLCPDGADIASVALELVNQARSQSRTCGNQSYPATTPLTWSNRVAQVSYGHSLDMSGNNFFSHTGSDGLNPGHRLTNSGYIWRAYGENIAAGYSSITATVQGWLDSPGHCANIMNPNVTEMGVACAYNSDSDYRLYWTQKFGAPR